jgi:outer membrane lipoprotein SlyB
LASSNFFIRSDSGFHRSVAKSDIDMPMMVFPDGAAGAVVGGAAGADVGGAAGAVVGGAAGADVGGAGGGVAGAVHAPNTMDNTAMIEMIISERFILWFIAFLLD